MKLSSKAEEVIRQGSIKLRVNRSGMFQQLTFKVRMTKLGNIEYVELFTDRQIELAELAKISEETGLPVEASNGKAFPHGKSASDFQQN
ncbi:MAG: hypothetical protein M1286_02020 [Candidatus Marsarchaeota archaeon]|nr:hypothetical protein [Candidatus Marsarchaeota archaeon]